MKKNMLKTLLLSTLSASILFTSTVGKASLSPTTDVPISPSDVVAASQTTEVGTKTSGQEAAEANAKFRKLEKESKKQNKNASQYGKEAADFEKKAADAKKASEDAKAHAEVYYQQARNASDRKSYEENIQNMKAAQEEAKKKYEDYLTYTQQAKDKRAAQEEAQDRADAAETAARQERANRDDFVAGDKFETLMWQIRDADYDVAEGAFKQSGNLSDKTRAAQKTLKKKDEEIKKGAFAQRKNMETGFEDELEISMMAPFEEKDKKEIKKLAKDATYEAKKDLKAKNFDDELEISMMDPFEETDREAIGQLAKDDAGDKLQTAKLARQEELDRARLVGENGMESVLGKIEDMEKIENLAQEDNETQKDLKAQDYEVWMNSAAGHHNMVLGEEDRETQSRLIGLDYEVWDLSYLGYHWWTMDYGLAHNWALKPLEFGYLSYHSALNDTMGDFSSAEMLYSQIFDLASLGVSALNGVSGVIKGVEDVVDAVGNFRRDDLVKDINEAREKKEEAMARSDALSNEATDARNAARQALMDAEIAENAASGHKADFEKYDADARKFFDDEQRLGNEADDLERKAQEALKNAETARAFADAYAQQNGIADDAVLGNDRAAVAAAEEGKNASMAEAEAQYAKYREYSQQAEEKRQQQAQAAAAKEDALFKAADSSNYEQMERENAANARAAAQAASDQADKLDKKRSAADTAVKLYENQENKAKQDLRDLVGANDADTNVARSEARMAQAEKGLEQTNAKLAETSALKQQYNDAYEQNMRAAQDAEDERQRLFAAAESARRINDIDSYNQYIIDMGNAANASDQYKNDAASLKMIADSYSREETRLQGVSDSYTSQINTERQNQASLKATQGVKEAEYAVLTGEATEEQKQLYSKAKQYEESQKLSKQADAWAKKVPTPTEIVRGAGEVVSQGSGKVIEGASDLGVGGVARTAGDVISTTRKLYGW